MDWKMRVILKLKKETSITVMLMTFPVAENTNFLQALKLEIEEHSEKMELQWNMKKTKLMTKGRQAALKLPI